MSSENRKKTYCICGKGNDDQMYVQCQDGCEWYHPECVGFDQALVRRCGDDLLFLCPFCQPSTKNKCFEHENKK